MYDEKRKIENIEMFKILLFPPVLHFPQMETDSYIWDNMGTEVIENNARHREMQDLHKAPLCNVAQSHYVFNPIMSLLQFFSMGDLTSCCCPLSHMSPHLVPLNPSLHFVPVAKLSRIIFPHCLSCHFPLDYFFLPPSMFCPVVPRLLSPSVFDS